MYPLPKNEVAFLEGGSTSRRDGDSTCIPAPPLDTEDKLERARAQRLAIARHENSGGGDVEASFELRNTLRGVAAQQVSAPSHSSSNGHAATPGPFTGNFVEPARAASHRHFRITLRLSPQRSRDRLRRRQEVEPGDSRRDWRKIERGHDRHVLARPSIPPQGRNRSPSDRGRPLPSPPRLQCHTVALPDNFSRRHRPTANTLVSPPVRRITISD